MSHDPEENTVTTPPNLRDHPDVSALRTRLQHIADRLSPAPGEALDTHRERALLAVRAAAADVEVDPTLALRGEGQRWVDLLAELARQMSPVFRQAALATEATRLNRDPALSERDRSRALLRLGKINPRAAEEAASLAKRSEQVAGELHALVNPHWNDPEHRTGLARRRLDHTALGRAAEQLRLAVSAAEEIDSHLPEVQALLAMATTVDETAAGPRPCAAPDCEHPLPPAEPGRTRRYCSQACRTRARRAAAKR